ncbi:hypothetical protein P7C71_g4270, partial [Lecanoromycetidae sp. Uapishka_2]
MGELLKFEREIEKHIEGDADFNTFQKDWNRRELEFRKVLANSRPVLVFPNPPTPSQSRDTPNGENTVTPSPSRRKNITVLEIDSDSDVERKVGSVRTGMKRPHASTQSTPCKISRIVPQFEGYNVTSRRFSLEEVHSIIQDAYVGRLPDQIAPKATERIIKLSMAHWSKPIDRFLDLAKDHCQNLVSQQVQKCFGHHQQTLYYGDINDVCYEFFEEASSEQHKIAEQLLRWEQMRPGTHDDGAMKMATEKSRVLLQNRDHELRARPFVEEQEAKSGKFTTGQARLEKCLKFPEDQLPPTVHHLEITAMSVSLLHWFGLQNTNDHERLSKATMNVPTLDL